MPTASGNPTYAEQKASRKQRWWWEALADFWLANPTATNAEAAKFFNRTEGTIQLIKNTDGFRALMAQRRQEYKETFDVAIQAKVAGVAFTALDNMLLVLQKKKDTLPLEQLVRVVDTAREFTAAPKGTPAPTTVVNVQQNALLPVAASMDDLEVARAALRRQQQELATQPIAILPPVEKEEVLAPPKDPLEDPA